MAVEQLATSDASTLMLCQAATALIMQISTLLEKLPGSAAAFLSRKDTIALFNGKEGTRNTFLCSSGLGTRFLLPISLGNSRRGSPAPTWLREGLQGKATSKADVKGALAKTRKGTPLPSSPNLCRIRTCKVRRGALIPVYILTQGFICSGKGTCHPLGPSAWQVEGEKAKRVFPHTL